MMLVKHHLAVESFSLHIIPTRYGRDLLCVEATVAQVPLLVLPLPLKQKFDF